MFTHRTATPGRVGANDGYGVDAALSFYQNVRVRRLPRRARRPRAATATTSVIAASSTTTATSTACRPSTSSSSRTSCRRSASCAAPTCGATSAWPATARGHASVPNLRRLTTQASLNYLTNNQNRLDTREATARFETEFTNSDLFSVTYTDSFERLVRPFAIATGVTLPVGSYDFHTTRIGYIGGQQRPISGRDRLRDRPVLQRRSQVDLRSTPRACRSRRRCRSSRASRSTGSICVQGSFTAKVARTRATYTITPRMFVSGIVQYNTRRHLVRQQRALPVGVSPRQRAVRRLHRRLQHRRTPPRRHLASQSRVRDQVQPPLPPVKCGLWVPGPTTCVAHGLVGARHHCNL